MVSPDIRRLQILNDLIAQTLDAINARATLTVGVPGLSHTPWGGEYLPQAWPQTGAYGQVPYGLGAGYSPFTAGIPMTDPRAYANGLSHSPFVGQVPGGIPMAGMPVTDPRVMFGAQSFRTPYYW